MKEIGIRIWGGLLENPVSARWRKLGASWGASWYRTGAAQAGASAAHGVAQATKMVFHYTGS